VFFCLFCGLFLLHILSFLPQETLEQGHKHTKKTVL